MSVITNDVVTVSAHPIASALSDEGRVVVEPVLLTAAQVAAMLQISTRTLWRLLSGRNVPEPVRLGGAVRWRQEDIKNWIDAGCPSQAARENAPRRK